MPCYLHSTMKIEDTEVLRW